MWLGLIAAILPGGFPPPGTPPEGGGSFLRVALWAVLGFIAAFLGVLAWTASLKRQVRERTLDLRCATRAIREKERLLSSIVDTLPLALFAKDPNDGYRYVLWNSQAEAIFGIRREEILGRSDETFWLPEETASFRQTDQDVIARGVVLDLREEEIRSQSRGTLIVHTIKVPVRDSQGSPALLLGLSEDITERKRLEEERRALEVRLRDSEKLESLGSLASGVAHDMNNVLGSILGLATAFQGQAEPGSPLARALDTITKACTRGGSMVRGLLAFARQGLTEEKELDLNSLVRDEVQLLERTTLNRVSLDMDLAEGLLPIRGDASALAHAILNLCVNAVDAMPDQGVLTLRTRNVEGGCVEIRVCDTGCGMPPEVMARALEPFFTTKDHGTGLGLSIVHGTVQAHQGKMTMETEPGVGTQVILRFPSCAASPAPGKASQPQGEKAPSGALEILLVDDDDLIQSSVGSVLEALGHGFTSASSGEEALAGLEGGLEPDVVILDLNMPGLGGAGTLPRLRALRPRLPVILSTGRADQTALELTAAHPGVTLLAKPFTMAELRKALAEIPAK